MQSVSEEAGEHGCNTVGEQVERRGPGFVIKPQTDPPNAWEGEGSSGVVDVMVSGMTESPTSVHMKHCSG